MSPNLLAQNIHTATCMNNFGDYRKLTSFFTTILCIWGLIYKQCQCKKWGPKEAYAITDLSFKKKKKIGGKMWAPDPCIWTFWRQVELVVQNNKAMNWSQIV